MLFRPAFVAYGRSQARGPIGAAAAGLHRNLSNTRSLTHWARTGIEPSTSWFLVGFISAVPRWELLLFFIFCLFRATPTAYGSSQAMGQIRAVAAGLHHSHSNARSEPRLWSRPQLHQILNPLREAGDWTHVLMDTSQVCLPLSHYRNSLLGPLKKKFAHLWSIR